MQFRIINGGDVSTLWTFAADLDLAMITGNVQQFNTQWDTGGNQALIALGLIIMRAKLSYHTLQQ